MSHAIQTPSPAHERWENYAAAIGDLLASCRASTCDGLALDMDTALGQWRDAALRCREKGEIAFIGNGASASMASHCAADVMKNASIRTRTFTDLSMISAFGNDEGYENVFCMPIKLCMKSCDMLVAISSSGESPNIIKAVSVARQCGCHVLTLSAFAEGNALRKMGDYNIYVPAFSYGLAESCHAAVLHCWMDMLTNNG